METILVLEELYQFVRDEQIRCRTIFQKKGTESLWGQAHAYQNVMDTIDAKLEKLRLETSTS